MKRFALIFVTLASALSAADIAGSWRFNLISFGEEIAPARLEFKLEGDKLTGKLNELKVEGTAHGDTFQFTATRPNGNKFGEFEGRVKGAELAGTMRRDDETVPWVGRRATLPTAAPQTRTFEPTAFHRHFSGTIPPALHINPGD